MDWKSFATGHFDRKFIEQSIGDFPLAWLPEGTSIIIKKNSTVETIQNEERYKKLDNFLCV